MASELALTIGVSASVGAAVSAFDSLKDRIGQTAAVTRNLKKEHKELAEKIEQYTKREMPLSVIAEMTREYDRQTQTIERLKNATEALSKSQKSISENEQERAKLRGKMMETAAIAYLAVKPVSVAVQFEESFADLKKNVKDTPEGLERLKGEVLELTRSIPVAVEEMNRILAAGSEGGIARESLSKYGALVSKMKVSLDVTAEAAGGAVIKLNKIFGTGMAEAERVGDMIDSLSVTNALKAGKILDTLQQAGASIKNIGLSERQGAGLSAAFLAAGVSEENASESIRNMTDRLAAAEKQSPAFQAALQRMGYSAKSFRKALSQDAEGAIGHLITQLAKLPEARRVGVLFDLFGKKRAADMALLVGNADKYKQIMAQAADAAGAAGAMQKKFDERSETTANAFQLMKNEATALAIEMSDALLPMLRDLMKDFRPIIKTAAEFARNNKELTGGITKLAVYLLSAKVGFLGMRYMLLLLQSPVLQAIKAFRMLNAQYLLIQAGGTVSALQKIGVAVSLLPAPISKSKLAMRLFGTQMEATSASALKLSKRLKMVGAAGGIAAAGLTGWEFGTWIEKQLSQTLSAWRGYSTNLGGEIWEIVNGFKESCPVIAAALEFVFTLPSRMTEAGLEIASSLISAIGEGLSSEWEWMKAEYNRRVSDFADVIFGGTLIEKMSLIGTRIIDGLFGGICSKFQWLKEKLADLMGELPDPVKKALDIHSPSRVFARLGEMTMAGMAQGISGGAGEAMAALQETARKITASGALVLPLISASPLSAASAPEPFPARGAFASASARAPFSASAAPATVNITIHPAPRMDEERLARLVAQEIERARQQASARARSRLSDLD